MEERIKEALSELGVPHHLKGYTFIKQSLIMIGNDNSYRNGICNRLYVDVAIICDSTPGRIERVIRQAIEWVFSNTDNDVIKKYFGNSVKTRKGKVSNKHFLITLADYMLGY